MKRTVAAKLYGAEDGSVSRQQLLQLLEEDLRAMNIQVDKEYLDEVLRDMWGNLPAGMISRTYL